MIFIFAATQRHYDVHPLQTGLLRRKRRRNRRHGLPRESAIGFYPRRLREMLACVPGLWFFWRLWRLRRRVEREARAGSYTDVAIAPARDDHDEALELYQATAAARHAVARVRARDLRLRPAAEGS